MMQFWKNYLMDNLEKLLSLPHETQWLEFKENKLDSDMVGRYASALANGACLSNEESGWLLLGITDSLHQIVGTHKRWELLKQGNQNIELHLRTNLEPSIELQLFDIVIDKKIILALRVAAAKGEPVRYRGKAYIRINSQTTELSAYPDIIRKIYNSCVDWSAEVAPNATVDHLDNAAIELARNCFVENHPLMEHSVRTWSVMTLLEKLRLARNGSITRAAILLLGKPESASLISPYVSEITWRLQNEGEDAYEHFHPPFLITTSHVLNRIRNYRQKIFPTNSLIPEEVLKYEPEIILEALHNCIAHQDYQTHSRIIVIEKNDCLIFINSGNFFYGTPNDYLKSDCTPLQYRNKLLSIAMRELKMVDTIGCGIRKMYQKQKQRCFPLPDYAISGNQVAVTIHGKIIDQAYTNLLMEVEDMTLEMAMGLDRIQKNLPIDAELVQQLRKKGFIEGRKGHYRIAASLAVATGKTSDYIKQKGVDRNLIKQYILNVLQDIESLSRADITASIENMLPKSFTATHKYNFITSLIREMAIKDKSIYNCTDSKKHARWKKCY